MFIHNICCCQAGAWFEGQDQYTKIACEVLHEVYATITGEQQPPDYHLMPEACKFSFHFVSCNLTK